MGVATTPSRWLRLLACGRQTSRSGPRGSWTRTAAGREQPASAQAIASEPDRHHHLVDVLVAEFVVVLADGLDLPAVGLQELDGLVVRRRDAVVHLLVPPAAGPLEAAAEEVAADAVAAVGLDDADREFGGVFEFFEFGACDVDPPDHVGADGGDEEHALFEFVVPEDDLFVVDDVRDGLGLDVRALAGDLPDGAHETCQVRLVGGPDDELHVAVAVLLGGDVVEGDGDAAVLDGDVAVASQDGYVVADAPRVEVESVVDVVEAALAVALDVVVDALAVVVTELHAVLDVHDSSY